MAFSKFHKEIQTPVGRSLTLKEARCRGPSAIGLNKRPRADVSRVRDGYEVSHLDGPQMTVDMTSQKPETGEKEIWQSDLINPVQQE